MSVAYLCSYIPRDPARNPLGEVRAITRGFACLPSELLTELETACRAKRGTLSFERISREAVDAWAQHYRDHGSRLYINKEGLDDDS